MCDIGFCLYLCPVIKFWCDKFWGLSQESFVLCCKAYLFALLWVRFTVTLHRQIKYELIRPCGLRSIAQHRKVLGFLYARTSFIYGGFGCLFLTTLLHGERLVFSLATGTGGRFSALNSQTKYKQMVPKTIFFNHPTDGMVADLDRETVQSMRESLGDAFAFLAQMHFENDSEKDTPRFEVILSSLTNFFYVLNLFNPARLWTNWCNNKQWPR